MENFLGSQTKKVTVSHEVPLSSILMRGRARRAIPLSKREHGIMVFVILAGENHCAGEVYVGVLEPLGSFGFLG